MLLCLAHSLCHVTRLSNSKSEEKRIYSSVLGKLRRLPRSDLQLAQSELQLLLRWGVLSTLQESNKAMLSSLLFLRTRQSFAPDSLEEGCCGCAWFFSLGFHSCFSVASCCALRRLYGLDIRIERWYRKNNLFLCHLSLR